MVAKYNKYSHYLVQAYKQFTSRRLLSSFLKNFVMRAIWSGAISFGLVNIPVKLNSAIESSEGLDFDMLSKKDMAPIRYARIDSKTGKEVPWKEIVKGFQYTKGKYVVVEDKDFAKA